MKTHLELSCCVAYSVLIGRVGEEHSPCERQHPEETLGCESLRSQRSSQKDGEREVLLKHEKPHIFHLVKKTIDFVSVTLHLPIFGKVSLIILMWHFIFFLNFLLCGTLK